MVSPRPAVRASHLSLGAALTDVLIVYAIAILNDEVGPAVWGKYVPEALASGQLLPRPEPLVLNGLEKTQEGLEKNKQGVSAKKVVIKLI